jgi:hypothetical protein
MSGQYVRRFISYRARDELRKRERVIKRWICNKRRMTVMSKSDEQEWWEGWKRGMSNVKLEYELW